MLIKEQDKGFFIGAGLIVVLLAAISWLTQYKIGEKTDHETRVKLQEYLDVAQHNLQAWHKNQIDAVEFWATTPQVQNLGRHLLDVHIASGNDRRALIAAPAQGQLRDWLKPVYNGKNFLGYFIIAPDGTNLASSRDANIGTATLLQQQTNFFEDVWSGKTRLSAPLPSDVPLTNSSGEPVHHNMTMFVATPVRNKEGEVMAIFTLRINVDESFARLFDNPHPEHSLEFLAFSRHGSLLSHSHLVNELPAEGLLGDAGSDIQKINLFQAPRLDTHGSAGTFVYEPITFYQDLHKPGTRFNLEGYRNYRGVKTIGAWLMQVLIKGDGLIDKCAS
jgi:hypothetical protein